MSEVNRETFLATLESVSAGLAAREIIEQSTCICFKDGKLCCFNDEVYAEAPSPLRDFTGAVKADKLLETLRKWQEETIKVETDESHLILIGKRRKAGIRMEASVSLPVDSVEKPTKWEKLSDDFLDAVHLVVQTAGRDESKPRLTCVHIHPKWVESSDDFQISRYRTRIGIAEPVLVKAMSLRHVHHLGATKFAQTDGWMFFQNNADITLGCRKYVEEYPDLSDYLKKEGGSPITLPKGMVEACDKAMVFSAENEDNVVQVEIRPGKLRLRGEGASGWYTETNKIAWKGPVLSFLVAPELLSELVKRHSEVEVTAEWMRVKSGKLTWWTCLHAPAERNGEASEPTQEEAVETE